MYRGQRRRAFTNAVRAAGRVAGRVAGRAVRAVRSYRPSRGMQLTAKTAIAGAFAKPVYKYGRRAYKKYVEKSDPAATGNEVTTFKQTIGSYPKLDNQRLLKLLKAGMISNVYRAQGITNFDTNVGFYPLANRAESDGSFRVNIPIHAWELTSFPNVDAGNGPGICFNWLGTASTSDITKFTLPITLADGSSTTTNWVPETTGADAELGTYPNVNKAIHDWTDIRLNLYGARKRGTTFTVRIVEVTDTSANFQYSSGSNQAFKDLIRYLQANLTYSNLQTFKSKCAKYIKTIYKQSFYVPGGSADDLDTIGKVKEVKLFYKNGKVYDFGWRSLSGTTENLGHLQADGPDFTDKQGPDNSPHPLKRQFLLVTAFSPERRSSTTAGWGALGMQMADADPLTEPSYDMILRNKWSIAT